MKRQVFNLKWGFEEKIQIDHTYVLTKASVNLDELTFFGVDGLTNIIYQISNDFLSIIYQKPENGLNKELANASVLYVFGIQKWNFNENFTGLVVGNSSQRDMKFNFVSYLTENCFLLHSDFQVNFFPKQYYTFN